VLAIAGPLTQRQRPSLRVTAGAVIVSAGAVAVTGWGRADLIGVIMAVALIGCAAGLKSSRSLPHETASGFATCQRRMRPTPRKAGRRAPAATQLCGGGSACSGEKGGRACQRVRRFGRLVGSGGAGREVQRWPLVVVCIESTRHLLYISEHASSGGCEDSG
jgi:hypothetical protein